MFTIQKTFEFAASHCLELDYESRCTHIHGHNFVCTVWCQAEALNEHGMVIDFTEIKRRVHDVLDHQDLNAVLPFNPTAEHLAQWIQEQIPFCVKVSVQESPNNVATYAI